MNNPFILPEGFWIEDRYFALMKKYDPNSISRDVYFGDRGLYVQLNMNWVQRWWFKLTRKKT